jgi:hypothetical protein
VPYSKTPPVENVQATYTVIMFRLLQRLRDVGCSGLESRFEKSFKEKVERVLKKGNEALVLNPS